MGNAYSTEPSAHRGPQRLTKPRTYNHSSSPKLGAHAGSPQSSKSSNFDADDVVWTSAGSLRSKQEARQQIRMQLFGPHEEEALFHREATAPSDHVDATLEDLAANINDRLTLLSRSGSIPSDAGRQRTSTMQSTSAFGASKASLEPEKRTIDIEAAIDILQELKKTATPEQLVALHKALLPTRDEPAAVDTNNQAPPKLARRRSMAVPGLATRNPFDVLRRQDDAPIGRSASSVEEETHLWKMEEIGPSPLAKIASLDVPQDSRMDHRAQTPGDMDYATLGNKIGTLMITNGAPSPAPSIISRRLDRRGSLPELPHADDDAVESDDCDDAGYPLNYQPPRRLYAELDASSTEIPRMIRRSRVPSELMLNQFADQPASEDSGRRPTRKLSKLSAEEYIAELHNSPYGESPFSRATPSPRPPQEDFDEVHHGQHDTDMYRAEALRILDGDSAVASLPYDEKILVEQPSGAMSDTRFKKGLVNSTLQRPAQAPHSDSGYSSGASLKAVRRSKAQGSEADRSVIYSSQQKDTHVNENIRSVTSAFNQQQNDRAIDEPAEASSQGADKDGKQNSKQKSTVEAKAENKSEWRKSLRRSKSWKRLSLRALTSPSPSPTPGTPEPAEPKDLNSEPLKPMRHDSAIEHKSPEKNESQPARKKLQKRKSAAANPTVQNIKPIETGTIPDVPSEVSTGLSKRVEESPGMDHLEHTCVSENSSVEQSDVPIRFPSPGPVEDARDTISSLPQQNSKKKRTSKSTHSPSPLKYALSFRRKSKEVSNRQEEADKSSREATPTPPPKSVRQEVEAGSSVPTISDFGTVARSLGGSPYDIALSSMPTRPQVSASSAVQPHHFSTNVIPASKTGRNMDAATASETSKRIVRGSKMSGNGSKNVSGNTLNARGSKRNANVKKRNANVKKRNANGKKRSINGKKRSINGNKKRSVSDKKNISGNKKKSIGGKKRSISSNKKSTGCSKRRIGCNSVAIAPSSTGSTGSTGYNSMNSSTTDLNNNNNNNNNDKPLPQEPIRGSSKPAYRPYRRGLLIKSYSQSTAPSLTRAATFDIREEKIPVEDEEVENIPPNRGIVRRHTEDLRPRTAEEKIVVELEDDLAMADARREEQRRERELPPSLRIQTRDWEQTSKIWRERREAFRSQSQQERQLPRSLSVQHPRTQEQRHDQPPRMKLHVRSQSQQATQRPHLEAPTSHSHSQSSSAASSAKVSPAISPAWSPVPQEISSPDKQLPPPPNPFAAASAATRTKKRSSIQRYYSTKNKSNPLQNGKTSVESVAEE
ncbi:hypothetical protein SLS57_000255 [Botryosphaeria dothidea]